MCRAKFPGEETIRDKYKTVCQRLDAIDTTINGIQRAIKLIAENMPQKKCDRLSDDEFVLVVRQIKALQIALGVVPDGSVGSETMAALRRNRLTYKV